MSEYVLIHHGTKGMRWGVRRYQNKDGSLTPAGRKRYADEVHDGMSDDHVRSRAKPTSSMTDKELNDAVIRLQREKQYDQLYSELATPKKSAGAKFAGKFVEKMGDKLIESSVNAIGNKILSPTAERLLGIAGDGLYNRVAASRRGQKFLVKFGYADDRARRDMRRELDDDDLARRYERMILR